MYVVNVGWFIRKSWDLVSMFLNPIAVSKFNFLGSEYKEVLPREIGADNLEKKYGGNQPNLEKNFFPPVMGQNSFFYT